MSKSLRTALDGMIASLRTKEAVKRVSFKIPFVLGKDLSIGIVGCAPFALQDRAETVILTPVNARSYNLIGEETKRLPTKVDLSTAAGVEVITKTVYKDQVRAPLAARTCASSGSDRRGNRTRAQSWTARPRSRSTFRSAGQTSSAERRQASSFSAMPTSAKSRCVSLREPPEPRVSRG